MPAGDSHGFWAPGDGTLREFDAMFDCGPEGANSRSERIVRAIRMYIDIHEQFRKENFEPKDERHERRVVRYAVLDSLRRDREQADG